jgi:hypothetical protein
MEVRAVNPAFLNAQEERATSDKSFGPRKSHHLSSISPHERVTTEVEDLFATMFVGPKVRVSPLYYSRFFSEEK